MIICLCAMGDNLNNYSFVGADSSRDWLIRTEAFIAVAPLDKQRDASRSRSHRKSSLKELLNHQIVNLQ